MKQIVTLFVGTFTTLLAIINPLEALPVFLKLLEGQDEEAHRQVARKSCFYATLLTLFFLLFGNFMLRIFGVPLSMVRIVGGIILMRIGFSLFMPSSSSNLMPSAGNGSNQQNRDVAFVPLAIPIMFGPGGIATVLGMSSTVKQSGAIIASMAAIVLAIVATLFTTYLILAYAKRIVRRMGSLGIDAATRIVGFFVSAMGMALIFHGLIEAVQDYAAILGR
jgi:multiple antibiotic resistance protein